MDDHGEISYTTNQHETTVADSTPSIRTSINDESVKSVFRKSNVTLFGISESLADHVNPRTVLTIQQAIILIGLTLLMIVLLQIPTILYYANRPPSPLLAGTSFISDINVDTCSVS